MIILIPAYEPGDRLLGLIDSINNELTNPWIVIVDDGSGPRYRHIFDAARSRGADVLSYPDNRGKGFALKQGFVFIEGRSPNASIVCADCDGQHTAHDIERVALALEQGRSPIVLGARAFTGSVPLRSRFGNAVTRLAFAAATRTRIADTQTGLRAYRPELLAWLQTVDGDRFEYELNLLLDACDRGIDITEIPIETIYLDENASSHFRTIVDSVRVYWPLTKFSISSLAAFFIDFVCLLVFMAITSNLLVSVIAARLVSASVNFMTNRHFVFAARSGPARRAAARYAGLVAVLLGANYLMLRVLTAASFGLVPAKIITEATLFAVSYQIQKRVVFGDRTDAAPAFSDVPVDVAA